MAMTPRERMLTALGNGRPDRLPCQVHGWMDYYLRAHLPGMDWYEANDHLGLDHAIYVSPEYGYAEAEMANWAVRTLSLGTDKDGVHRWMTTITTPKGTLTSQSASNAFTTWTTEHPIKSPDDFMLWNEYCPVPVSADFTPMERAKDRLRDRGIIRSHPFSPGQGSPWQSLCTLYGTGEAILLGMDDPATLHGMLEAIVSRTLRVTELWQGIPSDMVEVGGGAGSNTVISPSFFREFCLPYDKLQNQAFHDVGLKVVYHLCGGLMKMLDLVVETGADGLETMTPPSMGGDCDLAEASRLVGDKLFFMGGFDQNGGFERGTPETARRMVMECFEATRDYAGYIIAPSDHFFFGDPANIKAFADACRDCAY